MPPEASSRPEIGLNFIVTSTSLSGPGGATMTLNSFLVARCTSTFLPLGAPAIFSTTHCPSTRVQPSMPFVSKSNRSVGRSSGTLISAGAADARARPVMPQAARMVSALFNKLLRGIPGSCIAPLLQCLGHRLPFLALDERDVRDGVAVLECRHDADHAESLVLLGRGGGGGIQRPLGFRHRFALCLVGRQVVPAGDRLGLRDLARLVVNDDLGELVALHRVHRQLELAVLDLVFRRDRFAFLRTGAEATFERDLR